MITYVRVRVHTSAKKERVISHATHIELFVREKAVRNEANQRIRTLVAEYFQVPVAQVRICNGHHGSSKLLSVWKH